MLRAESVRTPVLALSLLNCLLRENGPTERVVGSMNPEGPLRLGSGGLQLREDPPSSSPRKAPPPVPSSWLAPILPTLKLPKEWVGMGDAGLGLPLVDFSIGLVLLPQGRLHRQSEKPTDRAEKSLSSCD